MFQRLDVVALHVQDWKASLDWYTTQLDLVPYHVEDAHRFAVLGLAGGGAVHHLVGDSDGASKSGSRWIPMIAVDDFDAALARLETAEVEMLSVVGDTDDGYRMLQIQTPRETPSVSTRCRRRRYPPNSRGA